jgi:ribosomal protein S18 acetylase RimI-like enzyme
MYLERSYRRLEEAAMNAWPAHQSILIDGWIVRLADGYTKRANSVNPTYPAESDDLVAKMATCEAIFARAALPCIVRLTSFGAPAGLDELLAARGFRHFDRSLVLHRTLPNPLPVPREGMVLRTREIDDWLDCYCALSSAPLERRNDHMAILRRISSEAIFATLDEGASDRPVACGLAVIENNLAGLFDIVTDRERRNQGFGSALVMALLRSALAAGATSAYLQVVAENEPAIALYRKLSFQDAYHYWYRMPPAG